MCSQNQSSDFESDSPFNSFVWLLPPRPLDIFSAMAATSTFDRPLHSPGDDVARVEPRPELADDTVLGLACEFVMVDGDESYVRPGSLAMRLDL